MRVTILAISVPADALTMMTSSNGNIFRVTGHLCGEFTGPRWIPRTKASDVDRALMFSLICVWINGWVNTREAGDMRCYRAHYDVTLKTITVLSHDQKQCWRHIYHWSNPANHRRINHTYYIWIQNLTKQNKNIKTYANLWNIVYF